MTAALSIYGRLGQAPRPITTRNGKAMATASVAVEIATRGEHTHTEWFGLVAFNDLAERLLKHQQGEMVSVSGRLQMNTWQDREGNARQQWQVVADTLISARTVRPSGGRKPANGQGQKPANQQEAYRASRDYQSPRRSPQRSGDFNDSIPF